MPERNEVPDLRSQTKFQFLEGALPVVGRWGAMEQNAELRILFQIRNFL
jgi:hypothetical protein